MKFKVIIGFLVIGVAAASLSAITFANPKSLTSKGLTVTPAIENLTIEPNQLSDKYNITLTNNSSSAIQILLSAQDFTTASTPGNINLITSQSPASTHGLADWLTFPVQLTSLAAHSSITLPVIVTKINQLAPGGHYAAVMVRVVPSSLYGQSNGLASKQVIASLLFLNTYGHGLDKIKLEPLNIGFLEFSFPNSINLAFYNTGNVQTAPRGLVTIDNFERTEVARGLININSGLLLPSTTALYATSLTNEGGIKLPGVYTATIRYRSSGSSSVEVFSQKFLYVNTPVALAIGLVILALIVSYIRRSGINYKYIFNRRPKT